MTYYVCVLKEDRTRPVLTVNASTQEEAEQIASHTQGVIRVYDTWDWTRMEQ